MIELIIAGGVLYGCMQLCKSGQDYCRCQILEGMPLLSLHKKYSNFS